MVGGLSGAFCIGVASAALLSDGAPERRAADFLLRSQRESGAWYADDRDLDSMGRVLSITIASAHALLSVEASERHVRAAEKALAYFEARVSATASRRTHGGFDFNGLAIADGLHHIHGLVERWPAGRTRPDVGKTIAILIEYARMRQEASGGRDPASGAENVSSPFLASLLLEGLALWPAGASASSRAIEDLERSRSAADPVELAVTREGALVRLGRAEAIALEPHLEKYFRAAGPARSPRRPGHSTEMIAALHCRRGRYAAARALAPFLAAHPSAMPRVRGWAKSLRDAIVAEQAPDGGFESCPPKCGAGMAHGAALALLELDALARATLPFAPGLDAAIAAGRERNLPVAVFVTDGTAAATEVESALADASSGGGVGNLVWCRVDLSRAGDAEAARRLEARSAPALFVLFAGEENPFANPARRLFGTEIPARAREILAAAARPEADRPK